MGAPEAIRLPATDDPIAGLTPHQLQALSDLLNACIPAAEQLWPGCETAVMIDEEAATIVISVPIWPVANVPQERS